MKFSRQRFPNTISKDSNRYQHKQTSRSMMVLVIP